MHDICEGIAQYHIKLLLKELTQNKTILVSELNDHLQHFDYGYSENDRPGPILSRTLNSPDSKIHLSAAQTLLFCRMLPLLIGDKIGEGDPSWRGFLLLLDIIDIAVSPIVSEGLCGHLKLIIEEYLEFFKSHYPNNSIIPKMHFLVHYPEQMMAIGPLVRAWTMRCEAKLNLFKRASHLGNFKNIALTLSRRHQRWLCYKSSTDALLKQQFECGPSSLSHALSSETQDFKESFHQLLPNVNHDTIISHPSWIQVNGVLYKQNNCYVITGSDGTDPTFARVVDIIVASPDVSLLKLQSYPVSYFDEHFHSYVIYESSHVFLCLVHTIINISHNVLHSRKLHGKLYLTLKHYVFV